MSKRDLFVFAGQSNMMGAAVLPPKLPLNVTDSYEYKHKPRRLGADKGEFVAVGYPCGEFSYVDEMLDTAYAPENIDENGKSTLKKYTAKTYFCPGMCNLKDAETFEQSPFDSFSEADMINGPTLAPLFADEWERRGQKCAFAHIAKGAVTITHYFNSEMVDEYNRKATDYNNKNEIKLPIIGEKKAMWLGASAYFDKKATDFFEDAKARFEGDDMGNKVFVWCQGEGNSGTPKDYYKFCMEVLWNHVRSLGFTHFFCVRVGNWCVGERGDLTRVMRAQEEFCAENENCYIITRAMSFMPHPVADKPDWFTETPNDEYNECRDCFFGFENAHINEKGFATIARHMADNSVKVLREGVAPELEKEIVARMLKED